MTTNHLLFFFNFFINRFKAIEQKFAAKAAQAEAAAAAFLKQKEAHLAESAKASRIAERLTSIFE